MNKKLEQLKIKQAVLKAVRKISGAAFSDKLGDDFDISFTDTKEIGIISVYATCLGEHINCFTSWSGFGAHWQSSHPKSISDITRFEADIERGLAEIFEYVKVNK